MSETNGKHARVIEIADEGWAVFSYRGIEFRIDVIAASNRWASIDASFRIDEDQIAQDRKEEHQQAAYDFVKGMLLASLPETATDVQAKIMTMPQAGALIFLAELTKEAMRLKDFFDVESPGAPSSPPSTPEVTFST